MIEWMLYSLHSWDEFFFWALNFTIFFLSPLKLLCLPSLKTLDPFHTKYIPTGVK